MAQYIVPDLKISMFEGPLDLLFHLIEKNDIDIYDIPIAEITDQYMVFLKDMDALDMEFASEFLVMAATLIHVKSRMLLPDRKAMLAMEEEDPREELVIRLLQYRRCKMLAQDLRERYKVYSNAYYRLPSTPFSLDIEVQIPPQEFDPEGFARAISSVNTRNAIRFADLSAKITHILKRDKVSVRDKMKLVWQKLIANGKMFFHEIFPTQSTSKIEKVVGFLAVLELLRGNQISAEQDRPFDVILLAEIKEHAPVKSKKAVKEPNLPLKGEVTI
jgi:segregation and condensation protein A